MNFQVRRSWTAISLIVVAMEVGLMAFTNMPKYTQFHPNKITLTQARVALATLMLGEKASLS